MTQSRVNWLMIVLSALILGFVTLSQWPPYNDFTPFVIPPWVPDAAAVLFGVLTALLFEDGPVALGAAVVLLMLSISLPVAATAVSSYLLGTTAMIDLILYMSLQRAFGQSVALFIFIIVGLALGIIARAVLGKALE